MGGNVPEEDGVEHRVEPKLWLTDGSDGGAAPGDAEPVQSAAADAPGDANPLPELPLPGNSGVPSNSNGSAGQEVPYPGQDIPYTGQQIAFDPTAASAEPAERGNSYGSSAAPDPYGQETQQQDEGFRIPPYQAHVPASQAAPPPSQAAPPLPPPPVPPYPAQVPPGPPAGMAAKVTAPFAALTRPKTNKTKTKKPPRTSRPTPPPPPPPGPSQVRERVAAATRTGNVPRGTAPTRRAHLVLARIEPWSVMKFSFMVSLVGWVVLFVAVAALYYVLDKLGVFHSIQSTITDVTSSKGSGGTDANGQWFSASRILGYTMLVGAINVVLITALATVGAVIYNLVTHLAGGIEVTLKETD
jgi:Transmembrane domain of unknown function (DUF3566)